MADSRKKLFKAGALIYIETDEDSDDVFILEEGEVELGGAAGIKHFRPMLKPGDIFGSTSCLCRRPRMESARATSDSTVVVLERETFLGLVQSKPELASRIISYFAEELRAYDEMIVGPSTADLSGEEARLFELGGLFLRREMTSYAWHAFSAYARCFPTGLYAEEARKQLAALNQRGVAAPAPVQRGLCRVFGDRQMVFCEHEPGEELYIIKAGKVEIRKTTPSEEILLSILREGDIFGELSIVSHKPRSASAVATGEATILPITGQSLSVVFERSPAIIARILIAISQRIWFTFIRLQSRLFENPLTRTYVLLENKLLEERVSLVSTKPVNLPLSLEEILAMSGVPLGQREGLKSALTDDPNFSFHFRQLTVESPSVLATRARYYRTRDHLEIPELDLAAKTQKRRPAAPRTIGLDPHELRVPPESIPEK